MLVTLRRASQDQNIFSRSDRKFSLKTRCLVTVVYFEVRDFGHMYLLDRLRTPGNNSVALGRILDSTKVG